MMNLRTPYRLGGVLILASVLTGGCARPAGVIFEPLANPPFWPSPPDPVRVLYVGELATSADLKPSADFFELAGEALFGKKTVRSMLSPYALCTDGRDRLFVADSNAQVVHVFNFKTRAYSQWQPADDHGKTTPFSQPVGIAYDPDGRLIVADSVAQTLHVFDDHGKYVGQLGQHMLQRPCGLAIDPTSRRLYIADVAAHQVLVFSLRGELIRRLGQRGDKLGQFNFPTNVAVDSQGRLYVSDSLNFRVQQFDRDLEPLRQIGQQGDMPGYFSQPKGLAVDGEDHLYVVDAQFEAVQIFNAEGQLLMVFGEEGTEPGRFWLPAGIHIDRSSRIWIADTYNRRVQVFEYHLEDLP